MGDTTYKMSFDNTLQPTVRRFGLWLASGEIGVGTTIAGNAASNLETKTGAQAKVDSHNALESPHNLPSYTKMQSDGFKVFDNLDQLRCHLGQYAAGKYGLKVINGEIYSTLFKTGTETDTSYVTLKPGFEPLLVVENGKTAMTIWSLGGGMIQLYDTGLNDMCGQLLAVNDLYGANLRVSGRNNRGYSENVVIDGDYIYITPDSVCQVNGNFYVSGGTKNCTEETSVGLVALSARESPEIRYVDENIGQLVDGTCTITLDPVFLEIIEAHSPTTPWIIHLTPYGDFDLFVPESEIGNDCFVVRERNGGTSTGKFAWKLSAVRRGFAGVRFDRRDSEEDVLVSGWEDELMGELNNEQV